MGNIAILASIKPNYADDVYDNKKTIELRKNIPAKAVEMWAQGPVRIFWYESGTGTVTGESEFTGYLKVKSPTEYALKYACVTREEYEAYSAGKLLYHWMIKNPRKYTESIPLQEFGINRPPQSWMYVDVEPLPLLTDVEDTDD